MSKNEFAGGSSMQEFVGDGDEVSPRETFTASERWFVNEDAKKEFLEKGENDDA